MRRIPQIDRWPGADHEARSPLPPGLIAALLAAAALVAGLAVTVRWAASPPPLAPPPAKVERPAILGVAPLRLVEAGIDPVKVEPGRIDPRTGLREDVLARGHFEAPEAPVLRLALTRGAGAERAPGLFVLLARRAAVPMAGGMPLSVRRTGSRDAVATRFGTAETVEATLTGEVTRRCTGFVTAQPGLRIDGFLCGPLGTAPDARSLACTLDSLELDDPGDPTVSAAFATARAASDCPATAAAEGPSRTGSVPRRQADTKN